MKLVVIGATGMAGSRIAVEAACRGHLVTAASRNPDRFPGELLAAAPRITHEMVDADRRESLRTLLSGADAVVLSIRAPESNPTAILGTTATVLAASAELGVRLLVIGGAGPLSAPPPATVLVVDDPRYVPPQWRSSATVSVSQLAVCREYPNADWTYVSPSAGFAPGARHLDYRRGTTTLLRDRNGNSRVSAETMAVAVLDEIEHPQGQRHFTVADH